MAHNCIGAHRLIKGLPTATLLAAALLSPPLYAQQPIQEPPESVSTDEVTEVEAVEEDPAEVIASETDRLIDQIKQQYPELTPAMLDQIRAQVKDLQFGRSIDDEIPNPDADVEFEEPVEPAEVKESPPDADALIVAEQKRKEAEALITQLAGAKQEDVARIEKALAELGQASLVPLKLAALSDDFDLRTRAGAMARRLRWRLVCSASVLRQYATLPEVMAGEDSKPRRSMIDALVAGPQADYVPLFVECLADRDQYIRERGIDGLVLIGESLDKLAAGRALQKAALHSDDKSVVLLSIAGLGEIEMAEIGVLTKIFEQTEHAEVQRTILMTAGYTRNAQAIGLIERALKDPRWRVRAAGLEALEDIYRNAESANIGSIVAPLLTDPEPFIRANALRLVAKLKDPGTASTIWKLVEDGSIDQAIGLETLASLQDGRAYQTIANEYEAATMAGQHGDAQRWLTNLAEYEERESVDSLLKKIIQDTTLRKQWPTAIYLASRRDNDSQYVPIVAPMLLDEDADIRTTVWSNFGRYGMSSYTLPTELNQGLAKGDTEQRLWRLSLIYQKIDIGSDTALYDALSDDNTTVVNQALAMISQLLIKDSLGEEDLPYRDSEDEFLRAVSGERIPQPTKPTLSDTATQQIRGTLSNASPLARDRAAALLYVLDKDRGDNVSQILKQAIQSREPGRVAVGLLAAKSHHGSLLEGADLLKIAQNNNNDMYLLSHLCSVMLQVGDKELVDAALNIAKNFEIYRHQDFFIGLASSGSQNAIDLVKRKVLDEGSYYGRRMIQQMVDTSPDAAIDIGTALLRSSDLDSYDKRDIISNLIRAKKNDKLIPLLKEQIKLALAETDEYDRYQAQQYQQMLLSIDPASAQKEIIGALVNGDIAEQQQAISTLMQINEPDEQIVQMVLKTVLERRAEVDPSWSLLVGWLKQSDQHTKLEEKFSEMPGTIQSALLAEKAGTIGRDDFSDLLSIKPANVDVRDRVTMMVAELTTKYPELRPESMDNQPSIARVYLLAAAGQWDGGETVLRSWLDHEDRATAEAALRGLSIACLLDDKRQLSEEDAARLTAGVMSEDAYTAYLSTEALFQLDRPRLLAIDTNKVSSRLALLRIGCAGQDNVKGPVADAIEKTLKTIVGGDSTETRLALIASIQSEQQVDFEHAWQLNQLAYAQRDLLPKAIHKFHSLDLLYQTMYMDYDLAEDPDVLAAVEKAITQAKGSPNMYLGMFLDRGFVKSVPLDQAELFLKSLAIWSAEDGMESSIDELVSVFEGDPAAVKAELRKIMKSGKSPALEAAMMLYQLDRDDETLNAIRESIKKISPQTIERTGVATTQYAALEVIQHAGKPEDATFLIDMFEILNSSDSWQAESLGQYVLSAAAMIDSDQVRRHYLANESKIEDAMPVYFEGDPLSIIDLLNAQIIDVADEQTRLIKPERSFLTRQLQAIKAGNKVGGAIATPPWDYYANTDEDREMSQEQFAKFERDVTLLWVEAGEIDQEKMEQFNQASYEHQNWLYWTINTPYHEQLLYTDNLYFGKSGVIFNEPDVTDSPGFYASLDRVVTAVPGSSIKDETISRLAPLIQSEDPMVAARAIRVAATWRAVTLRESLFAAMNRSDAVGVEAAWASARLFGPDALELILKRAKASEDYDERVELACLLTLIGEDQWAPAVMADARRLLTVQQLRGRAITAVQRFGSDNVSRYSNDIFYDEWDDRRGNSTSLESISDGRMSNAQPQWETLLLAVMNVPTEDSLSRRLDLMPEINNEAYRVPTPMYRAPDQPLALRTNLSGGLTFAEGATNNLPLPELVGTDAPMFMQLEIRESALFSATLTQRASWGMGGRDLDIAWQDWLADHVLAGPDALWLAGVSDAIQSLNDPMWWRRALARERLQRLTGQVVEPPALFDNEAWASLQGKWQAWAGTEQAASARAALSNVALEAGLIETAPTSDAEELAMLVKMAGFGSNIQSNAALHRLNLWPDGQALVKAAESWQTSHRAQLRAWYLHGATDQPRIYVRAEDIK